MKIEEWKKKNKGMKMMDENGRMKNNGRHSHSIMISEHRKREGIDLIKWDKYDNFTNSSSPV
jgi:hypothetical protein